MTSGVYAIVNRNGHCYIGSSVDLHKRCLWHLRHLRGWTHHCGHLQKAWNKYGEPSFVFTQLEECPPQDCTRREQWWIDFLRPVYNICQMATSPLGVRRSDATRAKISAAMIGRKHSAEARAKMRRAWQARRATNPPQRSACILRRSDGTTEQGCGRSDLAEDEKRG